MTYKQKLNRLAKRIGLGDEKGYILPIAIAVIVVFATVGGYYLATRSPPEAYSTIYLLDTQKKAVDYPETLVINHNKTLNVYVDVINHMRKTQGFQVLVKVTNDSNLEFPVVTQPQETFSMTLADGETWENPSSVTIDTAGNYSVVFELWLVNADGTLKFSGNACVLNIDAVNQA